MLEKSSLPDSSAFKQHIEIARGLKKADLVLKNGKYLDVFTGQFIGGDIAISGGSIVGVKETYQGENEWDLQGLYICPGFIDTHTHIESSLLTPARFEEAVLPRGTTTVIWDPHEIANVWGIKGIEWAIAASENLSLDIFIMLPSCVPATSFELGLETSGSQLLGIDLEPFKFHQRVLGLAEMMNYPGLLHGDPEVVDKLVRFRKQKRDGHCPGLSGYDLNAYASCGIHSCHESVTLEEGKEKLIKGIHVLIREGSCAKNARTLLPLLNDYTSSVLGLCSDDRNPFDIDAQGHLDAIVNIACSEGHDLKNILRSASWGGAQIYGLGDRGAIAPGYLADLCIYALNDPENVRAGISIKQVLKKGKIVDHAHFAPTVETKQAIPTVNIKMPKILPDHFIITPPSAKRNVEVSVIEVVKNQIITTHKKIDREVTFEQATDLSIDVKNDILKIAVFERHHQTGHYSVGFVTGFGLKSGAIATSVNHDSHNCIVVGTSHEAMADACNYLKEIDGGIVVWQNSSNFLALPLPIAGLMTDSSPKEVADRLKELKKLAQKLGCFLDEPFLQLSFLALPVIPELKITDRGLVDVSRFKLIPVVS